MTLIFNIEVPKDIAEFTFDTILQRIAKTSTLENYLKGNFVKFDWEEDPLAYSSKRAQRVGDVRSRLH